MGNDIRGRIAEPATAPAPAPALRLPRTELGAVDGPQLLRQLWTAAPAFVAVWGVFWLTGQGIATDRADLIVGLATAAPLWVAGRAWRLPWWLHVGAASLPLSIGLVALAHADPAGLVRGTKFAYGALLFLGVAAWARSARRRLAIGLALVIVATYGFFVSLARWLAVADNPFDLMRGTLDWHNQFASQMLVGLSIGLMIAALGRGRWTVLAVLGSAFCGAGIILSGSRIGLVLAAVAAGASLAAGIAVALRERRAGPVLGWAAATAGALLLPLFLRSAIFFPTANGSLNPFDALLHRHTVEGSVVTRWAWWLASGKIGLDHPVAGTGLLTFDTWSVCYGAGAKWHPHNEWAYAWAEGGIIALVPLLLLLAGVITLLALAVRGGVSPARLVSDPVRWGALTAITLSIARLVTEYDFYYPVLVALMALSAGVCAAASARATDLPRAASRAAAWSSLAVILSIGVLGLILDPSFELLPWAEASESARCLYR